MGLFSESLKQNYTYYIWYVIIAPSGNDTVMSFVYRDDAIDQKLQLLKNKIGLEKFPLYFDNAATTVVDPKVLEVMLPFFTKQYGNSSSRTHKFGWAAEQAVEDARREIANLISAKPEEIIFTSGATESNNLAIQGAYDYHKNNSNKNHIIVLQTDHKSAINVVRNLTQYRDAKVTYLPVHKNGVIDLEELKKVITDSTLLLSLSHVNSETGTIQPIEHIAEICKAHKILLHCDIAQSFGKIPIDVNKMDIDLASISGHKIYGPKGVGALYIRRKPRVRIKAIIYGGNQERGIRSGTLAIPLIVGLGKAATIASEILDSEYQRIQSLSKHFITILQKNLEEIFLNGEIKNKYPGINNISFSCVEGESLLMALNDLALSSGSACTSKSLESSYVLRAMKIDENLSHTSLRFSLGRFNTRDEIDYAALSTIKAVRKLREISPLWEMHQNGVNLHSIKWS